MADQRMFARRVLALWVEELAVRKTAERTSYLRLQYLPTQLCQLAPAADPVPPVEPNTETWFDRPPVSHQAHQRSPILVEATCSLVLASNDYPEQFVLSSG